MAIDKRILNIVIFWRVRNYYDAIKPFQYIAWFFGLGYIVDTRLKRPSAYRFEYAFTLLWLIFFITLNYINSTQDYLAIMSTSVIANSIKRTIILYGMYLCVGVMVSSYFVRGRFSKVFNKIDEFDDAMIAMGVDIDRKWVSFKVNISTVLTHTFMTLIVSLSAIYFDTCDTKLHCIYVHAPQYVINIIVKLSCDHTWIILISIIIRFNILTNHFM